MNLTIHTYGYFDALYYVLKGLAMFRGHNFYTTIVTTITIITGCYWGMLMAYSPNASGGNWRGYLLKIFGMVIMVNSLLLPKTSMILNDHVTRRITKIDNIPLAFALPVGVIEEFGYVITRGFEQAFMPIEVSTNPNSSVFSYYNYGMLFGQRLRQEVSSTRIKDPEFIGNMQRFIKRCVVLPAMIGTQFTTKQLFETNDIWKLVSSKAGTLTRVEIDNNSKRVSANCKDAAKHFEQYFEHENKRIFGKYSNSDFAMAYSGDGKKSSKLNNLLQTNIKTLYGGHISAKKILQQQMMINSLSDYRATGSSNYGVARARMQQESGWLLSSKLAAIYLPMMLVVFKSIVYSAFIFLVPMLIISGGFAKYKGYLTVVASLQLWPALNAVLNMIIGTYSNLHLKANSGSGMLISFSTASSIGNHIDSIVAVASGLQMVIPFLAIWMTQLGMGGLMHLAGNIVGGLQSTSGAIGGELASGNRSFDNIHENNSQRGIHSSNKTDYNLQYASGASTYQHGDGTREQINALGKVSLTSGANINASSGLAKANIEQSIHHQINEGIQTTESALESEQHSFTEAQRDTFNKTADFVEHIADREAAGKTINYEELGEQGKTLQQAVNNVHSLRDQYGENWRQNKDLNLKALLLAGVKTPDLLPIVKAEASIAAEGNISASNSSDQSLTDEGSVTKEKNTNESYNNLVKSGMNESWSRDNNIDNSYSNAIRKSYEKSAALEKQVSQRREELDSWHQAKSMLQSSGGSISRDIYHDIENKLKEDYNLTGKEAHDLIDKGDSRAIAVTKKIISDNTQSLLDDINQGKAQLSKETAAQNFADFREKYIDKINHYPEHEILKLSRDKGLDVYKVKALIKQKHDALSSKHQDTTDENDTKYTTVKADNQNLYKKLKKQADEYEKNRLFGQKGNLDSAVKKINDFTGKNFTSIGRSKKK